MSAFARLVLIMIVNNTSIIKEIEDMTTEYKFTHNISGVLMFSYRKCVLHTLEFAHVETGQMSEQGYRKPHLSDTV